LLFTPGKDPTQLLTVALPLYLWLLACRRRSIWVAACAGLCLVPALLVSLVHAWIAVVVVVATLLGTRGVPAQPRGLLLRVCFPATGAALLGAAGLYLLCGLDLLATARAVAASQAAVTRGPGAMPLARQLLGVPLFLLLAGPAWWATVLWNGGRYGRPAFATEEAAGSARLGRYLLLGSGLVMLATIGFTNLETPRLWIPFVPLLLLGGLLQLPLLRGPAARTRLLLAALVFVQATCSAAHWSLMDMRETETRIVEERFFG
jgi:hypothetical protein